MMVMILFIHFVKLNSELPQRLHLKKVPPVKINLLTFLLSNSSPAFLFFKHGRKTLISRPTGPTDWQCVTILAGKLLSEGLARLSHNQNSSGLKPTCFFPVPAWPFSNTTKKCMLGSFFTPNWLIGLSVLAR